jgi:hypothetical protein
MHPHSSHLSLLFTIADRVSYIYAVFEFVSAATKVEPTVDSPKAHLLSSADFVAAIPCTAHRLELIAAAIKTWANNICTYVSVNTSDLSDGLKARLDLLNFSSASIPHHLHKIYSRSHHDAYLRKKSSQNCSK